MISTKTYLLLIVVAVDAAVCQSLSTTFCLTAQVAIATLSTATYSTVIAFTV